MTVEDRVRTATRAIAGTVDDVRPLSLPSASSPRVRRWHPWRHWAAPLTAAAAMAAIGIALASVQNVPNGRGVPPSRPAVSAEVPAYYVAIDATALLTSPARAVVGDTRTGARLATISPPAHDGFSGVTGAADDRTFVLSVMSPVRGNWPLMGKEGSQSWYSLRIAPGTDHPAQLTKLPIPATPANAVVYGMALSPDGSELAVAWQQLDPATGPGKLQIYSVDTGALLRTWSGPDTGLDTGDYVPLSWTADGRTLAFGYGAEVRMLDVTRSGQDLIADSRLVVFSPGSQDRPQHSCAALVVTPDGKTVVCSALTLARSAAAPKGTLVWNGVEFLEYSTATGKLTRTLYQYHANYSDAAADFNAVLWSSASGDTLVGCLNVPHHPLVGIITQGKFTRLSFPLPGGVPIATAGIAW